MSEPLVLVTGATDGIGRETVRLLLARGARVIAHGRSQSKLDALAAETGVDTVRADLASLAQVRAMAGELRERDLIPEVLLHNAGIFATQRALSEDGFELTQAVNHLATVRLTHDLVAEPSRVRRVILVSSMAHQRGKVDPADVGLVNRPFDGYGHYGASKLANVLFAVALAPRLAARGIHVNALHPGVVSTKLLTEGFKMKGPDSLSEGATTSVMLALDPIGGEKTGAYFSGGREARPAAAAGDEALAERFYQASCEAAGVEPLASIDAWPAPDARPNPASSR